MAVATGQFSSKYSCPFFYSHWSNVILFFFFSMSIQRVLHEVKTRLAWERIRTWVISNKTNLGSCWCSIYSGANIYAVFMSTLTGQPTQATPARSLLTGEGILLMSKCYLYKVKQCHHMTPVVFITSLPPPFVHTFRNHYNRNIIRDLINS